MKIYLKDALDDTMECFLKQTVFDFLQKNDWSRMPYTLKILFKSNCQIWSFNENIFSAETALNMILSFENIDGIRKIVIE